jgi:dsRNA-specific ribonuclease
VAEAHFGRMVSRAEIETFVGWIEQENLARRDDERPQMLWVQTPALSDPAGAEARFEEELKRENPKGRLLELCMRERLPAPVTTFAVEGALHVAVTTVAMPDGEISSGPQRAPVKRTAEQLAAKAILDEAGRRSAAVSFEDADEREAELKAQNPKGKLLERRVGERRSAPTFESRAVAGGYLVRAHLEDGGGNLAGGWYRARSLKIAEHAAAESVLALLEGHCATPVEDKSVKPGEQMSSVEPRMLLNEFSQVGEIAAFGYRLVAQGGPSHQPVFTVAAWADLPEGERIEGSAAQAASKKAAERAAASALVAALVERGIGL